MFPCLLLVHIENKLLMSVWKACTNRACENGIKNLYSRNACKLTVFTIKRSGDRQFSICLGSRAKTQSSARPPRKNRARPREGCLLHSGLHLRPGQCLVRRPMVISTCRPRMTSCSASSCKWGCFRTRQI